MAYLQSMGAGRWSVHGRSKLFVVDVQRPLVAIVQSFSCQVFQKFKKVTCKAVFGAQRMIRCEDEALTSQKSTSESRYHLNVQRKLNLNQSGKKHVYSRQQHHEAL